MRATTLPLLQLLLLLFAPLLVSAQFGNFFENMFQGGGGGRRQQNVASDSSWYQQTYSGAQCDKYLCPGTLSCVDKATHCPCAWPDHEEKFELDPDALALCVTKGKKTKRKIELARRGLL